MKKYCYFLVMAIFATISFTLTIYGNNKSEKQNDSVDVNKSGIIEATTRSYNSPDLAFFDLYDNVKSCEFEENEVTFNEKGVWSNMPAASWPEDEIQYYPELKKMPIYERDENGYISVRNNVSELEGITQEHYVWTDGKLTAIKTTSELGDTSLQYDDKGLLKIKQEVSEGGEGWQYYFITYSYSDYEFDEHGNWIKRNVLYTEHIIDDSGNKEFKENKFTENRTISYF